MLQKLFEKLFLVREIKSQIGEVHFRRWRIFWLPFFAIYINQIFRSDQDAHLHNHPWNFLSIILKGGYIESTLDDMSGSIYYPGNVAIHTRKDFHKISLIQPTTSLFFTFGFRKMWGYSVDGEFVDKVTYRRMKKDGQFDTK